VVVVVVEGGGTISSSEAAKVKTDSTSHQNHEDTIPTHQFTKGDTEDITSTRHSNQHTTSRPTRYLAQIQSGLMYLFWGQSKLHQWTDA
jgi:hypothetical protein